MVIKLFDYQKKTVKLLKSGSILCGGVGSGKSLTALAYYFVKECWGYIDEKDNKIDSPMMNPKDLYIITTARKRDTLEWDKECNKFLLSKNRDASHSGIQVEIDSWNNIDKYKEIKNAFFIFDEQRVVGSGSWVKAFLKITKNNNWLLLTATPGDTWMDYVPVFIANGFYKNRTEFLRNHVIFDNFVKYPKIKRYIDTWKLVEHRKKILVFMDYQKKTVQKHNYIKVEFDKEAYNKVSESRWNIFEDQPIVNISELCFVWRRITNSHTSRIIEIKKIIDKHNKIIIFYSFNYELDILKNFLRDQEIAFAEWNGHKHEPLPVSDINKKWAYLVQYTAGAEGWNCIETNTMVFYSQHYSYKIMHQAAGRIDRLNTPYKDLYYYHLYSESKIDLAINAALKNKKIFNEKDLF
jgi:hypothetical protein